MENAKASGATVFGSGRTTLWRCLAATLLLALPSAGCADGAADGTVPAATVTDEAAPSSEGSPSAALTPTATVAAPLTASSASASPGAPPIKIMLPRSMVNPSGGAGAGVGAAGAAASVAASPASATVGTNLSVHAGNRITYRGGHVMTGTVNVYYIWYGNWAGNSATEILEDLARNLGGSPWWEINTLYDDRFGGHVSSQVRFGGSTTDNYSKGTTLSGGDIYSVVDAAISGGRLPRDLNGVYFVLTAADVDQTDLLGTFCDDFCGWHTYNSPSNIKYAFVGSGDHCVKNSCSVPFSPNFNPAADEMASAVAHELSESVTDPQLDAWNSGGSIGENADQCAWNFGLTYTSDESGAQANVGLGTRNFLLQQNWVNAGGGYCAMSYRHQPISVGATHTLAVQTDGSLWSWGKNDKAQLGDGNTTDRFTPKMLSAGFGPTGPQWISVAAGNKFSFALRSDGTLWGWGDRSLGQVGDGVVSTSPQFAAKQIGGNDWAAVRAGDQHVVAIKKDGTLWSWGYNGFGQLGVGDAVNRASPVQELYGMSPWNTFTAGAVDTVAMRADGYLWSWGWNDQGTLGVGDTDPHVVPTFLSVPSAAGGFAMFGSGFDFSLGMGSNGTLWTWGGNPFGQLAAPSWQSFSTEPTQWISTSGWDAAATGYRHGMAVRGDGTLWTWGNNNAGQLGTGAAIGSSFGPVAQESTRATSWVMPYGHVDTSLALKADGAFYGWGNNSTGQLGLGDTTSRTTPVALTFSLSRPLVELDGPTFNESLKAPATIPLTALATGGRITKVEFWSGGTKLGEDTSSPYTFNMTNVGPGLYTLTAKAWNALGQSTTSAPVVVPVSSLSGTFATPGPSVNLTTDGSIDWVDMGLKTASTIDKKNVATHAISNFYYRQGESLNEVVRETGTALAVNWTDGTPDVKPHSDGTPTNTGVKPSFPVTGGAFEAFALGTSSKARVLSMYLKLVNATVTVTATQEGQLYTSTWTNTSTTPAYRVYKITYQPSTTGQDMLMDATLTTLRTGGNVSFLGATLH